MTIRSSQEEKQHVRLIVELVDSLQQRGYESIRAEHVEGFEDLRPQPIYSEKHDHYFTPDVSAKKDGKSVIFEVETAGSLDAPSSRAEQKTFASFAAKNEVLYYLAVPEDIRRRAEAVLAMIEEKRQRATFVLSLPI